MNRILFESNEIVGDRAVFSDVRAEHVLTVLHGTVGQVLKTGVLDGKIGTSVIEAIDNGKITVSCSHVADALPPWIDLILAPPRPRAMKRLLPQLASFGVRKIILVGAEKVEKAFWGAQLLKEEVYRPLLIEGLMQAGTTAVPKIQIEKNFRRYLENGRMDAEWAGCTERFVAHPGPWSPVRTGSSNTTALPVLAVGPEGGWTDAEVAALESRAFHRLSLGPRILRTDTAVIALLSRLMAF